MAKIASPKVIVRLVATVANGAAVRAQEGDLALSTQSLSTQSLSTSEFMSSAEFISADGLLEDVPLYLSVTLNGRDTGLIGEFVLHRNGRRLSSRWSELDQIGLVPPKPRRAEVYLDEIGGLTYAYDAAR